MTLAARIKDARVTLGLTQAELAKRARLSQQMIGKLESGKTLETSRIVAIAKALGVSPEWLATGTGAKARGVSEMRASYPVEAPALTVAVRDLQLALVLMADWFRRTRPAELPLFQESLADAIRRGGLDPETSILALMGQAAADPVAAIQAVHSAAQETNSVAATP